MYGHVLWYVLWYVLVVCIEYIPVCIRYELVCIEYIPVCIGMYCVSILYVLNYNTSKYRLNTYQGCLVQVGNGIELQAVGFQFEPYRWRPCGVTWDFVPNSRGNKAAANLRPTAIHTTIHAKYIVNVLACITIHANSYQHVLACIELVFGMYEIMIRANTDHWETNTCLLYQYVPI